MATPRASLDRGDPEEHQQPLVRFLVEKGLIYRPLELGVALLGAGVTFPEILRAGSALLAVVIGGVGACLAVGYLAGRALGLHGKLAILVAVGNAICGNSAIAAVAPVIRADKKDVASATGLTAVIGVCLVLRLPLLIVPLALDHYQYGVLAGMSVYAVPQVVAAVFLVSQLSGEVATLVKLTRVLLLGPVVLLMGLLFRGEGGTAKKGISAFVPWFVVAFLLLALFRSIELRAGSGGATAPRRKPATHHPGNGGPRLRSGARRRPHRRCTRGRGRHPNATVPRGIHDRADSGVPR